MDVRKQSSTDHETKVELSQTSKELKKFSKATILDLPIEHPTYESNHKFLYPHSGNHNYEKKNTMHTMALERNTGDSNSDAGLSPSGIVR